MLQRTDSLKRLGFSALYPVNGYPMNEGKRKEELLSRLEAAEAVRLDKRHLEAYHFFVSILQSNDSELLSTRQRNWACSHAATAALDAFTPYADQERLLLEAELLLREVLNVKRASLQQDPLLENDSFDRKGASKNELWSWARLGEVLRQIGNLPTFHFKDGKLHARNAFLAYKRSECCFKTARNVKSDYGWALAHHGAMLLNKRRYYASLEEAIKTPKCALDLIKCAAEVQAHRSPWTLNYLGVANFVIAIDSMLFPPDSEDDRGDVLPEIINKLVSSLYYVVVLWHSSPGLLKNPIQPGSFERDITFGMLYDFSTLAPYADGPARVNALKTMSTLAEIGGKIPKYEPFLPFDADIRQWYFNVYAPFLEYDGLAADATRDLRNESDKKGKVEKIKKSAMEIRRWAKIILEGSLQREQKLPENTANGVLASVLSVMMDLLKTCVILKKVKADTSLLQELCVILDDYDKRLPVLHGERGMQGNGNAERAVENLTRLHDDLGALDAVDKYASKRYWLLDPIWSFGDPVSEALRPRLHEVLNFTEDWLEAS